MEEVSIPVSGGKYVWVKNTDASNGKVVLHTLSLLGVVSPKVISGGVEEYVSNVPDNGNFFLSRESVEEWGYDIREYSAYTIEDTPKYVWYTGGSNRYVLAKQGHYGISLVALDDSFDASKLVGKKQYMFSEEEVENSVFDANKFLSVGENGLLVRGKVDGSGDVISAPYVTANGTALDLSHTPISAGNSHDVGKLTSSKITLGYKTTDKFKEALRKGVVFIPIGSDKEAAILSSIMEIDPGYKYHSEWYGGALIAVEGVPAIFSPTIDSYNGEMVAFEDAVEPL